MRIVSARVILIVGLLAIYLTWWLRKYVFVIRWKRGFKREIAGKGKDTCSKVKKLFIVPRKIDLFIQNVLKQDEGMKDTEAITRLFPRRFEVFGHVVVVKLNSGVTLEEFVHYAGAFAESFPNSTVDVVLLDTGGIKGELRQPQLVTLWARDASLITMPRESLKFLLKKVKDASQILSKDLKLFEASVESPTFTTCVENGVRYSFDVMKVMFCSGNGTERMHFSTVSARDEVVVDMFAGIGYFTLPLAMFGSVKVIHALEKNATSVGFLKYNAFQNGVHHLIRTYCGDNREVGEELCGQCDRVLMGYIPSCEAFLPRALMFLKQSPRGEPIGTIHYHFLSDKKTAVDTAKQHVKAVLGEHVISCMRITALRTVKSYSPKRFHHVADLCFEAS